MIVLLIASGFYVADYATAASWWGAGYKPPEWVLSHGGTVVYYKIIANGANDRYKAILYRGDGKFQEVENGKTGKFDDPKDGAYTVRAVRGGVQENKTRSGGKPILSVGFVARPGETVNIVLDTIKDKASVSYSKHAVDPAVPAKRDAVAKPDMPKVEVKKPLVKSAPVEVAPAPVVESQAVPAIEPQPAVVESGVGTGPVAAVGEAPRLQPVPLPFSKPYNCDICSALENGNDVRSALFPANP